MATIIEIFTDPVIIAALAGFIPLMAILIYAIIKGK